MKQSGCESDAQFRHTDLKESRQGDSPNRAGRLKGLVVEVVGWALVVAGIAGLFLPVLQGVVLLLAGLTILASRHRWAKRLMEKVLARFPSLRRRPPRS